MVNKSPPISEGGIFRISASSANQPEEGDKVVLWDRKGEGRFPEAKEVKQLVRDYVSPDKDLGHSDNKEKSGAKDENVKASDCNECKEEDKDQQTPHQRGSVQNQTDEQPNDESRVPSIFYKHDHVSIEYSTGMSIDSPDNALYRATYYADELLSMIYERNAWWKKKQQQGEGAEVANLDGDDVPVAVESVTLIPNRLENGVLRVKLNNNKILYEESGSASATAMMNGSHLRGIVIDVILWGGTSNDSRYVNNAEVEMMDDDEAKEARKYFGVF
eukprot:CAMPEP_0172529736 /NCGR_PEP_ID=MMETSP1067-20121228/3739_1 /TAXON_ID=265564 ORGANISM="Thalassiosira punctigera, Strain Tpunct2005C2" /NCGR_SAMPLE_ID=MMETSP1067 /ASSEMBLY_ACC=CAM_ASM_000444 /LENGTH=273 /DNA_ID=CAMNT_0013313847 /DNA_START=489 /DNA_END=1310 /DNA_ORIENTATION=-